MIHQIGVYLTEKGKHFVLVTEDHEMVFLTTCHRYGWTRDGAPNSPDTRRDHGRIVRMLWALAPPPPPP